MDSVNKLINNAIDACVIERNTTKVAFANEIGMSRSTLYDKLSGRSPWTLEEAINLCDALGISINLLASAYQG